ncbi:MAG: Fic family protein [Anaerovoracaceae bacterium]
MQQYKPPFTISNKMLTLVSSISEKIGKLNDYSYFENKPQLRKNNRIKSIHSSLAIEANSLSLEQMRNVLNGHIVIGPQKEIQEVRNAYKAYEEITKIDPYKVEELKRIHGVMTYLVVEDSGEFRQGEEGVFDGERCIFMAPSSKLVPELMDSLFSWMEMAKEELHPLILSSIFHYEFVFIHPFTDGNGRMARLWQTAVLSSWKPAFQYLPIESQIKDFQAEYYSAISQCHKEGNSDTFIEFMLEQIDRTLTDVMSRTSYLGEQVTEYVYRLLDVMEFDVPYTANAVMENLDMKSKESLRKNYINPAIEMNLITMTEPSKPTSRNQRYIKK